jgi:triosephosphate isomerase
MNYIYVNFKRFDVPSSFGGVNHISSIDDYGCTVVEKTLKQLDSYDPQKVKFVHYYPEAQIPQAIKAAQSSRNLFIGCQGVYRQDISKGGNFGAFTTNRPASAMKALGCSSTIIGHCEERNDKNELLKMGGNSNRKKVDEVLREEIKCALGQGLNVLYCIGEKAEEMEEWDQVLAEQLEIGLEGCDTSRIVIGYEPVWSIGPGKTPAGKEYITKVARLVKSIIPGIPVVYGGGLKKDNAVMLASIDEIDGGLIALTRFTGEIGFYPEEYLEIVKLYLDTKGASR